MANIPLQKIREGEVTTSDATLTIEMNDDRLALGEHQFQLNVVDTSGNESAKALVSVIILDQEAPTAVLRVLNSEGQRNNRIAFGEAFTLDATRSSDAGGGSIERYVWRLVGEDVQ